MDLTGKQAPQFSLLNQAEETKTMADYANKTLVLYFYPKAMTSGCTQESHDFQAALKGFANADAVVVGVSPDEVKKQKKFAEKEGYTFDLLADTEKELCKAVGVWQEKSMYGRKYMGVVRSTFVIRDGLVQKEWRKVKVPGHVDAVLEYVQGL